MAIPTYLPYFVAAGTAATLIAILYGLHRSLLEAGWTAADRARTVRTAAVNLLGWLVVAVALGAFGVYHGNSNEVPTMQYGIVVPILIGALMIWRSDTVRRVIAAVPQSWLVGIQLYRALGVIFLILYATGKLPGQFALPAGVGDIGIGLLAPVVGLGYARAPQTTAGLVAAWNAFGIFDLIVAVGTGFLTAPSLLVSTAVQPTSELMTVLPMVLIPVYLVPLSIVLHLASLAKLHRESRAPQTHGRTASAQGQF
jgi:hypothetical protein